MRKHVEESVATGVAAGRGRGGRFSAGRKREVVMRLLPGEDLESVSRAVGITAARASHWRAQFLAAGQAGLKSRAPDARDEDHRRLQAKIGELLMETELLYAKAHDGTITTETPDVMWGTDMTATVTVAEGAAVVFVAVDHCATACIGLHAAKRGTRFEALEPIRQGIRERFGGIGEGVARGLRLRHAHGSNDLADDFQQEVAFFGIESSPSFVREPEGNGVAERFIRTLKENLLWVRSFETIEELRLALLEFKRTHNEQWMLEKDDYRSPAQVRRDLLGLDAAA